MRAILTGLALAAVLLPTAVSAESTAERTATAVVVNQDQQPIGKASFTDGPNGVLIRLDLEKLPEGWHGIHLHMVGVCDDAGFKASGGHVKHGQEVHGLLNPEGPEDGDLPSIHAGADGSVHAEVFSWRVALAEGEGDRTNLLDADGTALVIHAKPDDQMSQPIGGAGDRIACGVLKLDE